MFKRKLYNNGFTMLELIFVILIIGILSGIAIPRFLGITDDAVVSKLKTEVSTVKSAISSKRTKLLLEGRDECPKLENSLTDGYYFEGVLVYPIPKESSMIKWDGNGTDYNVTYQNNIIKFHYDNNPDDGCKFECISPADGKFSCKLFK